MPHTLHDDPPVSAPIPTVPAAPTVTTATTVTTTVTPSDATVPWYKSQRFIALVQSTVLWVLGWLVAALSSNDWAWRAMAIGVGTNVLIVLKDWWNPAVQAPFAVMNKNNVAPVAKP